MMSRSFNHHPRNATAASRRGSALVLVAGVLVLLVIIAAAYINSSHGIRKTVVAQRQTANTDATAQLVAADIAREISEALFVREIDTNTSGSGGAQANLQALLWSGGGGVANGYSNRFLEDRRLPLISTKFMSDTGRLPRRYEVDRNFSWNYAPWEVVPRTNWPDVGGGGHGFWHGFNEADLTNNDGTQPEDIPGIVNPPGQPGTSDTRWLRDLEPYRTSTTYLNDVSTENDVNNYSRRGANLDTFSHYGHLTNLARPGNDWRICRDIADVTGVWSPQHRALEDGEITGLPSFGTAAPDGYNYFGGLLRDHHVPVEQWLPYAPASFFQSGSLLRDLRSGTSMFPPGGAQEFWSSWIRWFDYEGNAYAQQMAALGNTNYVPQNFYDLSNLDGDDAIYGEGGGELQERPGDEFRKGTARWHVSRVLTDTDGDGFTDSFWFHVPGSAAEGTMQVVGISITDNAGRLNANVASQFMRADANNLAFSRTRGWSPADLALVGQSATWESPTDADGNPYSGGGNGGWDNTDDDYSWSPDTHESWNVGILDTPMNSAGLFGVESDTGIPSFGMGDEDLVTFGSLGADAVDLPVQYQESEAYPIYHTKFFHDFNDGDMLDELGIASNPHFPDNTDANISSQINRLYYWQKAGKDPLDASMTFAPFTTSDEIELRTNEGNNQPWLMTRFERSLGDGRPYDFTGGEYNHLLRSFTHRQEQAELVDRLSARQLFFDARRQLTLFNGVRNEQLPPWLWWEYRGNRTSATNYLHGLPLSPPMDLLGLVGPTQSDYAPSYGFDSLADRWNGVLANTSSFGAVRSDPILSQFYDQMRTKLDLREHERFAPSLLGIGTQSYRPRTFSERLPYSLYLALNSGDMTAPPPLAANDDYFKSSSNPHDDPDDADPAENKSAQQMTRNMAASYAANILAWRDMDADVPLYTQAIPESLPHPILQDTVDLGAVRPPVFHHEYLEGTNSWAQPSLVAGGDGLVEQAYLGMEMQPFIMEAFIAHIVEPFEPPTEDDPFEDPILGEKYGWRNGGKLFVEYGHGQEEDTATFDTNSTISNLALDDRIEPSTSIVVVQLANPYDRPLPLFGRNSGGYLDRSLPLYKLRLFGQEITINDAGEAGAPSEDAPLRTMAFMGYPNPNPNLIDVPPDPDARLPLYLPPATSEAPYTLILYASGIDTDQEEQDWIDFLDIHPADHFHRPGFNPNQMVQNEPPHDYLLRRDLDGDGTLDWQAPELDNMDSDGIQRIFPGDLVCEVQVGWKTDRGGYDKDSNNIAIELLRTHRRDFNMDKSYDWSSSTTPQVHDYQVDMVIDRTGTYDVANDGSVSHYDEFHDVVSTSLWRERLPTLGELGSADNPMNGIMKIIEGGGDPLGGGQGGQVLSRFTTEPDLHGNSDFWGRFGDGPGSSFPEYSKIVSSLSQVRQPIPTRPRAFQFDITVPTGLGGSNARWCQWARYARAWGVDPGYPSIDTFYDDFPGENEIPTTTSILRGPINHLNRNAPRYIIGKGQVTRSKGRPMYVNGNGVVEDLVPRSPREVASNVSNSAPYFRMEQVAGPITDKAEGGPQYTTASIHVLNEDPRDGNINTPRYMWESGPGFQPGDAPARGPLDFKVSWGNVYEYRPGLPDGSYADGIGTIDADHHWERPPWFTRNYRMPATTEQAGLFTYLYANRKPTFFNMNMDAWQGVANGPMLDGYIFQLPDKGYYGYEGVEGKQELAPYGLQMLQKDAPFEQVGEVLNVWTWGHEIQLGLIGQGNIPSSTNTLTTQTFSEAMHGLAFQNDQGWDSESATDGKWFGDPFEDNTDNGIADNPYAVNLFQGDHRHINRLLLDPSMAVDHEGNGIGKPRGNPGGSSASRETYHTHIGHVEPDLSPGQRVLDLFVCDGPGTWDFWNNSNSLHGIGDGVVDTQQQVRSYLQFDPSFGNAQGFDGKATPGLININTATIEAMRALPHMYKMVHGTPDWSNGSILESTSSSELFDPHPRVGIPEAIAQYRNRQGNYSNAADFHAPDQLTGYAFGPGYDDRGHLPEAWDPTKPHVTLRGERGIAGLGELFNLNEPAWNNINFSRANGTYEVTGNELNFDAWTMDFAANDPFARRFYKTGSANSNPMNRIPVPAQLLRLRGPGADNDDWDGNPSNDMRRINPAWRSRWASDIPLVNPEYDQSQINMLSIGSPLSTDVNGMPLVHSSGQWDESQPTGFQNDLEFTYLAGDKVAGDAEEANLLFAGISNMISTRSDMFTVHFRIRTFKQNPETGVWDATDADAIVDDSRYVMLVDRSNVDTPEDRPVIRYLQKAEN